MKSYIRILSTIVLVLAVDLISKNFLFDVDYVNLIPNVISVASNGGNTGAAFGLFSGSTTALIFVSVLMVAALFVFNVFVKNKNMFYSISFGLIVGGALGNLYDRVKLGYVRDFIYLDFAPNFPIFNLADSCLCVGAAMMVVYILFMSGKKSEK